MVEQTTMKGLRFLVAGLVLAAMAVAAPATAEDAPPNPGTIKVHAEGEVDPDEQNQPHVSCDFYVEGFGMAGAEGHLEFHEIPPEGDHVLVMTANWSGEADPDGKGYAFLAGAFELPEGHYRVEAYVAEGHRGDEGHFSKAKTFWVDACEDAAPAPSCPENVYATAEKDGSIILGWNAVENASAYVVYRAEASGLFMVHATVAAGATTYHDTTTEVGTTYQYRVLAIVDGETVRTCDLVEATAIPFFPGVFGVAAAALGAVGIAVALRRR